MGHIGAPADLILVIGLTDFLPAPPATSSLPGLKLSLERRSAVCAGGAVVAGDATYWRATVLFATTTNGIVLGAAGLANRAAS
jgi:hypothetical protein